MIIWPMVNYFVVHARVALPFCSSVMESSVSEESWSMCRRWKLVQVSARVNGVCSLLWTRKAKAYKVVNRLSATRERKTPKPNNERVLCNGVHFCSLSCDNRVNSVLDCGVRCEQATHLSWCFPALNEKEMRSFSEFTKRGWAILANSSSKSVICWVLLTVEKPRHRLKKSPYLRILSIVT